MRAEIYWIPEISGGRLAILGRPRPGDWLDDEIADWKAAGITAVVSLLQSHEIRELSLTREAEIVTQLGLSFEQFPIPDRGVPESADSALALWARIEAKIRNGSAVGIHCRASIGRAGLVAAGVIMQLGAAESEAWHRASAARGRPVPDTEGQRLWVARAFSTTLRS